jgi:diamine N-acetyltransferase
VLPSTDSETARVVIRQAKIPQDVLVIQQIATLAWHATFSEILSPEFIAHELEREYSEKGILAQTANQHEFILIFNQDVAVGYASFQHLHDEGKTKLHKLYLLPECKGQGFGFRLISKVEDLACEQGMKAVELLVNRDNASIAFYQRQGYEVIGTLDTPVNDDFCREDYVMRKTIERIAPAISDR